MDIVINYLAVLVAAVLNMVVGFFWYGPVFGKMWKDLMGFTDQSMQNMKLTATQAMIGGFITSLIMAYVLAHFVVIYGAVGIAGAFELAFWIWLGFMATVCLGSFLWEGKSFKLFLLNTANQFVSLFLMTVVLVMWQ